MFHLCVSLLFALRPLFRRCPCLVSAFLLRSLPPSPHRAFLFHRLVCTLLPSALPPSSCRPVLSSVFFPRWQPRHQRWHVPFSLPLLSPLLSLALQRPVAPLCWCSCGEWGISSSCCRLGHHYTNDAAPAMIQKRTLLAAPCRRCISTSPRLYANNPNTLYRPCVLVSTPRQKISFRPCASCTHYTHVSVRTSYKYDKMWLVALHVLPWMHLPVSKPCRPCIATAAAPRRVYEC